MKLTQELDPLSLIISAIQGLHFYWARQYGQALDHLKKTLEMEPNFQVSRYHLAQAYAQKEVYDKAIEEAQKDIDLHGGRNTLFIATLGQIFAVSGKRSE